MVVFLRNPLIDYQSLSFFIPPGHGYALALSEPMLIVTRVPDSIFRFGTLSCGRKKICIQVKKLLSFVFANLANGSL